MTAPSAPAEAAPSSGNPAFATDPVAADIGSGYGDTTVTIPAGFWLASIAALFVGIFASMSPRRAAIGGMIYAVLQG